jgi:hypothetical protein
MQHLVNQKDSLGRMCHRIHLWISFESSGAHLSIAASMTSARASRRVPAPCSNRKPREEFKVSTLLFNDKRKLTTSQIKTFAVVSANFIDCSCCFPCIPVALKQFWQPDCISSLCWINHVED